MNIADRIEKQLPPQLVEFLRLAAAEAQRRGLGLYLVGGVVRDLLLGRSNFDLDLVLEGDAIELAKRLAEKTKGKIATHARFGTAKVRWDKWSADITTARSETYARPGALPAVKPGSLRDDLFRRDFTINAMAVALGIDSYGQLVDVFGGRSDLERKLIRVLHEKSFIDDATRIWRAVRYEQRLDFNIEPVTLGWLKRDIDCLDSISGDRIRHELELALKEECPEKVLHRAAELGVLARVHPSLKGNGWLEEKFRQARESGAIGVGFYLALLAYSLSVAEMEQLIAYLKPPKLTAQALRDTIHLKARLGALDKPELTPSAIYTLLNGYSLTALTANLLATDSMLARQHIELFISKLRHVKPALTGEDLLRLGVPQGPQIKAILASLLYARLDGKVNSQKEEEEWVRKWSQFGNRNGTAP